jgi:hypothetical protein
MADLQVRSFSPSYVNSVTNLSIQQSAARSHPSGLHPPAAKLFVITASFWVHLLRRRMSAGADAPACWHVRGSTN